MGMFCKVTVDNSIELPHFPDEIDREGMTWQSKRGLDVYGGPYRITEDGRLERKEESYRDKTDEEKQAEAEKWGFDSWEEYCQSYDEADINDEGMVPDAVDGEITFDDDTENPPTLTPRERTLEETWWADHNQHGTFEFHQVLKRDPVEFETVTGPNGEETIERPAEHALDVFLEYEARFDKGDLQRIVFMGTRQGYEDDPIGHALDKIEEWQEWKESQE